MNTNNPYLVRLEAIAKGHESVENTNTDTVEFIESIDVKSFNNDELREIISIITLHAANEDFVVNVNSNAQAINLSLKVLLEDAFEELRERTGFGVDFGS